MSVVKDLVNIMTSKEKSGFIQYLNSRNKRNDARNIDLFKAYSNGDENKIKKTIGDNAYNVLNKRLSDRLIDFLGGSALDTVVTEESHLLKQLLLARRLFVFNADKIA